MSDDRMTDDEVAAVVALRAACRKAAATAPALRWEGDYGRLDGGHWVLWAGDLTFAVTVVLGGNSVEIVRRGHNRTAIRARTLAESVLRELGVVFRVEEEPQP